MKDTGTKLAFIQARAEGKSYSTITKELGIAKATCTSWEQSLKGDIEALRQAQLEELYTAYGMKREARIKTLGDIIQGIDEAIAQKPLQDLPADKLLELRLKYGRELKAEYTEPAGQDTDDTLDGLLEQYNQLYTDSRAGNYSPAEIKAQLNVLEAKKTAIYSLANERDREKSALFDINIGYTSRVIRHEEDGQGA